MPSPRLATERSRALLGMPSTAAFAVVLLCVSSSACSSSCSRGSPQAAAPPVPAVVATTSGPAVARAIPLHDLRVTTGRVVELETGRLHVVDPKTRFVGSGPAASAEMRFTYRGPTKRTAALASGETRRQLGLKLRAHDGCNLVYVMWRIEPEAKLVVSVKHNPGADTHEECGAGGYENIVPSRRADIPVLTPGSSHVLAARIDGQRMQVRIDSAEVWEGELPSQAFVADGPAGVRTDNVDVDLDFATPR